MQKIIIVYFCLKYFKCITIASYIMLQKDSSNNEIMQELQSQDRMLNEQTNIFLKKDCRTKRRSFKEIR